MPANPRCIDVGAGAGLPGVPLRIFWTKGSWLMVEPREKRAAFLAYVLSRLELPRTSVVRARSEDLQEPHLPADFVTGRAAMPWPKFLELAAALLADGGRCIVFASEQRPGREPPEGFTLEEVREYRTAAGCRYFWSFAFSPRAASR
jgi:16S rRNA (guanine527-N7)-methyltransferase